MISKVKNATFLFLFLGVSSMLFSQQPFKIDFYGVISPDADQNMIKMTEDLYFTQLKDFGLTLTDLRKKTKGENIDSEEAIDFSESEKDSNAFFVIIKRQGDALSGWECKICLKDLKSDETFSTSRVYSSYYKILMESKETLSKTFDTLIADSHSKNLAQPKTSENARAAQATQNEKRLSYIEKSYAEQNNTTSSPSTAESPLDEITGVWGGEPFISKVVIMKGGRGFIIFKNGASMNISVKTNGLSEPKSVTIRQSGHSNASFFPELAREDAIEAAKSAPPIEWTLSLSNQNTLSGSKHTMVKTSSNTIAQGEISVTWNRI